MPSLPAAPLPVSDASGERSAIDAARFWIVTFAVVIAISFVLDAPLATALYRSGLDQNVKHFGGIVHFIKLGGYFGTTLLLSIVLLVFHPLHWRAAIFEAMCGFVAGANYILKWLVGRTRPFKLAPTDIAQPFHLSPFCGGIRGIFPPSADLSFVSGHIALAFAMAMGLFYLLPRHRWVAMVAFGGAGLVFCERVLENAHWLSDASCGAALGVGLVALLTRIQPFRRMLVV